MKIVYLYAELMPYQIIIFEELVKSYKANIVAVHWDKKKLTPFKLPEIEGVKYIPRSKFKTKDDLLVFAKDEKPDIIFCSGWMDDHYNYVAKSMKKEGVITVAGSDTQWKGGKQWLNVILAPFRQRKWFSYMWVSGIYQYEYSRKMGFHKNAILLNSLSANTPLYTPYGFENIESKAKHNFVYIGNFRSVKGTDILVEAFKKFKRKTNSDWKLICIGNGDMKDLLENDPDIIRIDFKNQTEICSLSKDFGVFVLPSRSEQWGLVLHEATCLGLPIISSEICGGNASFLINGFNGFSFKTGSVDSLAEKMEIVSQMNEKELQEMRENSFSLSGRITPHISASSLMSVTKQSRV